MKKINKILCLILIGYSLTACENVNNKRLCRLGIKNGSGMSGAYSKVYCDSFQMIGTKKVTIWVDGTEMNIEADGIYPWID
jgi:hypothetical protein